MVKPIKLDKVRNLRYSMRALSIIEKSFGKTIAKIDWNNLMIDELITVLWAGLIHEDKELTQERLFDIIEELGLSYTDLENAITGGLSDSYGDNEGQGENPNQAAAAQA